MKLTIHEAAAKEIQHHHGWYEARNPRVAGRLAELFEATIRQIAEAPNQFALMEMRRNPGNIRRAMLKGFPLYILYRTKDDEVEVFAVPHTSQRPGYWKSRLQN
jgi:toxin ParE1/3/4